MPIMGGLEATRASRDKGYTKNIIALAASTLQEDRENCLLAGCGDYLTKILDIARLREVLSRFLRKRSV